MRLLVLSFNWMSDESFVMSDCYKAYVYTPTLLTPITNNLSTRQLVNFSTR